MPTSEALPQASVYRTMENAPVGRVLLEDTHKAYEAWCRLTTTGGSVEGFRGGVV